MFIFLSFYPETNLEHLDNPQRYPRSHSLLQDERFLETRDKTDKMEIYVGNLAWSASEQDISDAFAAHGDVEKATIIVDRDSGRSKGFGFVTMNDPEQANAAIDALNGTDMGGRALKVNEARPREERPRRDRSDSW